MKSALQAVWVGSALSVVTLRSMCLTPSYGHARACQLRAHSSVSVPYPVLLRHCFALLSAGLQCQHFVRDGSNKVFFFLFLVNNGQLTLFSFPTETSKRKKLTAFLCLVEFLPVDLFTNST